MNVSPGLCKAAGENQSEDRFQRLPLPGIEFDAKVAPQIPLGEQIEFASQQCFVVQGQHGVAAGELPADQRIGRIAEQPVGIAIVERGEISRRAQVRQQQETLGKILCEYGGNVEACRGHEAGHVYERAAIFMLGWRIHDNERCIRQRDAEITPEAGVRGGWREREGPSGKLPGQPVVNKRVAIQAASLP
jgi:hypothetical protein